MPALRSAIHNAHDRGVLPQFRPDGNVRMMARALNLTAPISTRSLINLLDSLHFVGATPPAGTSTPPSPPTSEENHRQPTKPHIEVEVEDGSFRVKGTKFLADAQVSIRVVSETQPEFTHTTTADSEGSFEEPVSVSCVSRETLHFSATDGRPDGTDLLGSLISNTVPKSCP